jgi:hypothetical protein
MKYNAAYSAHQGLATQVALAAMAGKRPSDALLDAEKRSARELVQARERLRVAIAESAGESRRADGADQQ